MPPEHIHSFTFASDTVTNVYANRLRTGLRLQQPTGLWTNKFVYDMAGRLTYGKPFLADTPKTLRVHIVSLNDGEKLLFSKEYRFRGFDLGWDSKWDGDDTLNVTVFDRRPSGGAQSSQGPGAPPENLRVFRYRFDAKARMFVESS